MEQEVQHGRGAEPEDAGDARVTLLVRPGCHLCDVAREVVEVVCAESGAGWAEVDIDADGGDPALLEAYSDLVPVVLVDGVQQAFWRVDARRLRRALAR